MWSVADTVRQVRVSTDGEARVAPHWLAALREDYGAPKHDVEFGKQQSWEWSRAGETLLLVERILPGANVSTSVTLGTSPLITTTLSPESKRPPED